MNDLLNKYKQIVDCSTDWILLINSDYKYDIANIAFLDVYGFDKKNIIGKHISEIMAGDFNKIIQQNIDACFKGNTITSELKLNLCKDKQCYFEIILKPYYDENNKITHVIVNAKNITNQIIASQNLELETQKAKAANQVKDNLLTNISHELRTPLNCINGMLTILSDQNFDNDNNNYIQTAKQHSEILIEKITNILDLCNIKSGKIKSNIFNFDIKKLLLHILKIYTNKAVEKNLKIHFDIAKDIPEKLFGDAVNLREILDKIMDNAVKFTHSGSININVFLNNNFEKKYIICFSISDTGIGIEQRDLQTLFTPFFQLDGSITKKYEGMGIGLTISKQLVEIMEGNIEVQSELGKGTIFNIYVPFNKTDSIYKFNPLDNDNNIIDIRSAIAQLGDDETLFKETCNIFINDFPNQFARLKKCIENEELQDIIMYALSIKTSSATIKAHIIKNIAFEISKAANEKDYFKLDLYLDKLNEEFENLKNFLSNFFNNGNDL